MSSLSDSEESRRRGLMQRWVKDAVSRGLPVSALFFRPQALIGLAYLVGYVLLDWLSYIGPVAPVGITPWNPPTGLSFALVLLLGRDYIPWLFIAPFVSAALLVEPPLPLEVNLIGAAILGAGYGAATWLLTSPHLAFDRTLSGKRSLLLLIAVAAVSTAIISVVYVALLTAFNLATVSDIVELSIHQWIGDMIGITVLTPFLLILLTRRRILTPSIELLGIVLLLAVTIAAVFGLSDTFRVKHFYLFFLPVMWASVRFGLEGAAACLVLTQLGIMLTIHYAGVQPSDVTAYQALMIVLALTGLTIGAVVNEQIRTQAQLRQNQEALARAARLDTMGAFAAALAHEINQPLTAISNYARLAKIALDKPTPDTEIARQAAGHAVTQVDRAAEVVRRLRDFIRLGRNEMAVHAVPELIREAVSHCQSDLTAARVGVEIRIARNVSAVMCDGLQIQQVLINLIRNAAESVASTGRAGGHVVVEASRAETDRVRLAVRDNGPGFDPDILERALAPFTTTKSEGLGLGLALARSAAEIHGGKIQVESAGHGAAVSFTLPLATENRMTT